MKRFFDPESFFWKCFDKMADVLVLSMLWFLLCLPLVTIGASTTALYDAASRCVRGGEAGVYGRFFRTFKASLKPAALCTLLFGGALVLLAVGRHAAVAMAEGHRFMLAVAAAYLVLFACLAGYLCWLFPLLSRYELSFAQLCRTAAQFWFAHFPSTLAMVALLAVCAALVVRFLMPVCFLPALLALADSIFVERAFRRHTPTQT